MNEIVDYSTIPLENLNQQHLNARLAFICREIRYKKQELADLEKVKKDILDESIKREKGENNV